MTSEEYGQKVKEIRESGLSLPERRRLINAIFQEYSHWWYTGEGLSERAKKLLGY